MQVDDSDSGKEREADAEHAPRCYSPASLNFCALLSFICAVRCREPGTKRGFSLNPLSLFAHHRYPQTFPFPFLRILFRFLRFLDIPSRSCPSHYLILALAKSLRAFKSYISPACPYMNLPE